MADFLLDPQLYLYSRVKLPTITGVNTVADKYTYTVSCATPSVTFHYTTDGTNPTKTSPVLTGSLNVNHGTTLKVLATRSGFRPSPIAADTAIVTPRDPQITSTDHGVVTLTDTNINTQVGEVVTLQYKKGASGTWTNYNANNKPSFVHGDVVYARSVRAGLTSPGTAHATINIVIAAPTFKLTRTSDASGTLAISAESGATIYYKIDADTTWTTYSKTLTVSQHQTVQAYCNNLNKDSPTASIVTDFIPNTPSISINSVNGKVTITDNSTVSYPSALYYQVGSTTGSWTEFTSSTNLVVNNGQVVYARAKRQNLYSSNVSATCEIETIATPVITPSADTGDTTITCSTTLIKIYYTLDGSNPSTSSTEYKGTIKALNHNTVVKAIAYKLGKYSSLASATVNISLAAPTITKSSESVTDQTASVTLACATANSTIYYTANGDTPTTSSTRYTSAFTVNHGTTVKAISVKLGRSQSASSTIYVTPKAPSISISTADGTVTITNNNSSGTIQYWTSLDATKKTYSGTFAVDYNVTVYATCTRNSLTSSTTQKTCDIDLAKPVISYSADTGEGTVTCSTANSIVYYTTNNSDPKNGTVATGTIQFTHGMVVRAIAYKKGKWSTEATSVTISINLATPVISISTVSAAAGTGSATITVADTSKKTVLIEYSLDNSTWSTYSSAVSVDYSKTVYARATKLNKTTSSSKYAGSYITLAAPTVSIDDSGVVTFSKTNTGASVYYTTNGSDPTTSSTKWTSGNITVNHGTVVKVIEYRGTLYSSIASKTCSIALANAVISVADKSVANQTATVTITCSTADSSIYYTTNGTTPTASSTLYSGAFEVSHSTVIKAFTAKRGNTTAAQSKTAYVTPKAPNLSISSSDGTVTITDANSNEAARLYYTTDGTTPTASSTEWTSSSSLAVQHGTTVKAIAIRQSKTSSTSSATCSITLATPTISLALLNSANGTMTATVGNMTSGATYYYTVDNSPSDPTTSSSVYNSSSKPTVYHGQYIKVKGYKLGNSTTVVTSAQASVKPVAPTLTATLADKVTMTHSNTDTSAITIRYTEGANGADPTDPTATTGKVYSGVITSTENTRFDAITVRTSNGLTAVSSTSSVTVPSTTYSITKTAEDVANQTGTYKLSSTLAVDKIYYTIDGKTPTTSSSYVANNGTITGVKCDTVIKIKGYLNGVLDDEMYTTTAYITPKAPTITWSSDFNNTFSVTDNNTGDTAAIYVTIDGTTPSASNTTDIRTITTAVGNVKAVAVRHGLTSSVASSSHTIKLATPTVSWSARAATSGGGQVATITCSNIKGVTFYYTTDGTTPTTSSTSKVADTTSNSIKVDFGTAGTYTVKVFAAKKDYLSSAVFTDSERTIYKLSAPTITKAAIAGGQKVTFSCNIDTAGNTVSGIAIHYKNGDSVTASDTSTSHGGTVSLTPSAQTSYTYRALATKDNYVNSDNATPLTFTIYKLQAPSWGSFSNIENGKRITLTAYSAYVNGSNNTAVSGVTTSYTAPTSTLTLSGATSATKDWTGTAYPSGKTLTATSSLDGYISSTSTTTLTLYKLSTPTIAAAANVTPGKSVKITCGTYITSSGTGTVSGVKCHYTTNGTTTPTSSSSSVASGSSLTLTAAGTYTVKAIGILAGYVSSAIATGTEFSITQLIAPTIAKTAIVGGYTVTYTSAEGNTLYYSLNGGSSYSNTAIGSTGKYSADIKPSAQTTYNIWAYNRKAGYADSAVTKHAQFIIYKLATPTVGAAEAIAGGKRVLLTCAKDTAGNTVSSVDCCYSTSDTVTVSSPSVKSGNYVSYTPTAQTAYTVKCLGKLAGYITSDVATGTAFTIYKLSTPTVSAEEAIAAGKQVKFTCTTDTAGNAVSGVTIAVTSSPTTGVSATSVTSGNYVTYKPTDQTTYSITSVAKKNGYINSDASTAKSLTVYKLSTPVIASADIVGGRRLTFTCTTDTAGNNVTGITIRYANGTPTSSTSTTVSTGGTVDVKTAGSFGYKALATKNGYADSAVSSATSFTLYKLSKPTAAISDVVNGKQLTWTNATTYINGSSTSAVSGVTMVYQNATSGTATGSTTNATATVNFTGATFSNVTRTAYCQKSGYVTSDTTTSGAVTVRQLTSPTIGDPVNYVGGKKVALTCTTDTASGTGITGVKCYYTTNGTTPTTSSSNVASGSSVSLSSAGTFTIKTIAVKNGYMHSAVATDDAIIVYKLVLSYAASGTSATAGTGSVIVTSKANGSNVSATIYYASTSSGTASASTSSTSATGPTYTWSSQLHGNSFSALAQLSGYVSSDKTNYQLNIATAAPTITFTQPDANKTVTATITSTNTDAATKIYYSLTGTASTSSTVYTGAFTDFGTDPSSVAKVYACTARTANGLTSSPTAANKAFDPTIIGMPGEWMLAATDTSVVGSL